MFNGYRFIPNGFLAYQILDRHTGRQEDGAVEHLFILTAATQWEVYGQGY